MHGIEEGLLDKGCAEASDLLYVQTAVAHAIQATLEQAMGNQTHVQFFDTDL